MGLGLVELALTAEQDAKVVVGLGNVGRQRENFAIGRHRLDEPTGTVLALGQRDERVQAGWLWGRGVGRRHLSYLAGGRQPSSSASSGWRKGS